MKRSVPRRLDAVGQAMIDQKSCAGVFGFGLAHGGGEERDACRVRLERPAFLDPILASLTASFGCGGSTAIASASSWK